MENIQQYLIEEALILIPVLNLIGIYIKNLNAVKDKYIPIILWFFGIGLAFGLLGISFENFIQGTLISGASIFASQIYIQAQKDN